MTELNKPLRRLSRCTLGDSFGPDRGRRLVVELQPGDVISIRPAGTRRAESLTVADAYKLALRHRVACEVLVKAREKKARQEQLRKTRALARAVAREQS